MCLSPYTDLFTQVIINVLSDHHGFLASMYLCSLYKLNFCVWWELGDCGTKKEYLSRDLKIALNPEAVRKSMHGSN